MLYDYLFLFFITGDSAQLPQQNLAQMPKQNSTKMPRNSAQLKS
ncbi:hypothetical protein BLA29_015257 [Euroglyphus maynei]|uniref:Uncharacterized protein n=1 Tax=Euroglyphus maynei TaxID=6958 RepID=A0A1Y3BED0_EURMA|nr:hypothetical protein BLA29_015257 [Euroglyphus maynei]